MGWGLQEVMSRGGRARSARREQAEVFGHLPPCRLLACGGSWSPCRWNKVTDEPPVCLFSCRGGSARPHSERGRRCSALRGLEDSMFCDH